MNFPTTRFVFDRKKTATKDKAALIQVEILYQRQRKYVGTGVKVYRDQWNDRRLVINRPDMLSLNKRLEEVKGSIDGYITDVISGGGTFDFNAFSSWLTASTEKKRSFVEWLADAIDGRHDVTESSKKSQRKLVSALREFGGIRAFDDLTAANVKRFDSFLHSRGLKQSSVWSYHKVLRTYINEAIRLELMEKSPYLNFKVDKGKSEWGRFLTEEELTRIQTAPMPTESLSQVRDLFVVQCFTGMAYSDLMAFDFSKVRDNGNGQLIFSEERQKTGVTFTIVLLPQTLDILKRYDYHLPRFSNQQYNMRLKVVAAAAGIEKPVASHYGRRTCGMMLLNKGFPIEVVAKVLGHSEIRTTQQAYARILDSSVAREFAEKMGK